MTRTKSLTVYKFDYPHLGDTECGMRVMYVGVFHSQDWPGPVVTACVWPESFGSPYLDWLETTEPNRRQGYAAEMVELLERLHPGIMLDPVTPAGEAFCDAIERKAVSS